MAGVFVPPGRQTFYDPETGSPMVGGLVYHWIPTTDTPKDTWADEAQTVLNTNPILLDGNGQCTIWGAGLYRQKLTDADGVQKWDEVTGFAGSGGGGGAPVASPAETLAGLINDKYVSPYALANSGVLTIPYASGAEVLAGVVNNKGITPFALASSGVIPAKASAAEVAALANDTKFITPKALGDSGVLAGGGGNVPAVTDYGWIGDGVTDNAGLMAAMLASTSWDMRMPTGLFYISGAGPTQRARLVKRFWGPGRMLFDDAFCTPGRYSNISAAPTLWPTQGNTGFFRGDTQATEGEWHVLGPTVRESITARYFEGATIPHPIFYDVNSGASGMLARATTALAPGVGSAPLNSVDGITVGQVLAVSPWGQDGVITDTVTVDSVNPGPNTITFHPNLTTNYPASPANGAAPGYATFFAGKRTWNGVWYHRVIAGATGGGDSYGVIWRSQMNYVAKGGQIHVFNTATMGLAGGAQDFFTPYTYGTGWENQAADHGFDVAFSAFVDSLNRSNDTGSHSTFWAGHVFQSAGGVPVDTGVVQRGFFRIGLDLVLATLEDSTTTTALIVAGTSVVTVASTGGMFVGDTITICDGLRVPTETRTISAINFATKVVSISVPWTFGYGSGNKLILTHGGTALNLTVGQTAIVFNSSYSNAGRSGDPTGVFPVQYGNVTGDIVLRHGNDGTEFVDLSYNRASPNNARWRLRQAGFTTNVAFSSASSILAGGDIVCGAASRLGIGSGTGIYFFALGGSLYATANGQGTSTLLASP